MVKKEIVEAINNSPYKIYMAITGGGTGFIGDFLKFGGGSQTILGYEVPYHVVALDQYIGQKVDKSCSEEVANQMANVSFFKALSIAQIAKLPISLNKLIGVGVTASLTRGENEREGRWNGAYIAINIGAEITNYTVEFADGTRDEQEQNLIDAILVRVSEVIENGS